MNEKERPASRAHRFRRIGLIVLSCLFLTAVLTVALLPFLLPLLPTIDVTLDLSDYLPDKQAKLFRHHDARLSLTFRRDDEWDVVVCGEGTLLDWPVEFRARANYSIFGLSASGDARAHLLDTPWRPRARFTADLRDGWTAHLELPPTDFDETDPVVAVWRDELHRTSLTNLTVSGTVSLTLDAATTNGLPLATWKADSRLEDLRASWGPRDDRTVIRKAQARPTVSGLGAHVDVAPVFPTAESVDVGDLSFTNVYAAVLTGEKGFLASTVGAQIYGGEARIHSLYLDSETLNTGFTMFLDEIDAEQAINSLIGFKGRATGRLHGRLPLRYQAKNLRFGKSFLYSKPGQSGRLQLTKTDLIIDSMRAGGVSAEQCATTAKALGDMTYTALAIELELEDEATQTHVLRFHVEGSSMIGKTAVPVTLTINTRGRLEQLVNFTLKVKNGEFQ